MDVDPRLASRSYRSGPSDQSAPTSAVMLALAVQHLRTTNPDLLDTYLAAFVDQRTNKLYLQRSEPFPGHTAPGRILKEFPEFYDAIRANFDMLTGMRATHAMLVGMPPEINPLPALIRKSDVDWARVRLGWPESKFCKRLVALHEVRAPEQVRAGGIDCTLVMPSINFRICALGMRPPAGCADCGNTADLKPCSGCGKARYCSVACQRRQWPSHKQDCAILREADVFPSAQSLQEDLADV